jgi:hypothetical protein
VIRKPTARATGWIVASLLGAMLAWSLFSPTPLRLGDRKLRVYDVRDLLVDVPDFRFDGGGEAEPDDERTREQRVRDLAEQVRAHVAPGTWGPDDLVSFGEGLRLMIVASDAKHQLVQDYFHQIRAQQRVQVTVEARFVSLGDGPPEQLDNVLAAAGRGGASEPLFLDDADVMKLLRAAQASRTATIVTAPRMTVHNGQRSFVLIDTQRGYVSDVTATPGPDGSVKYDANIDLAISGVLLEARATASADRRHVTLYFHPRLTQLRGMDSLDAGAGPDGKDVSIQRPHTWTAEVHQTFTIPDGKTLLIRKIPKPPDPPAKGEVPKPGPPEEMLILVKVTILDPAKPPAAPPAGAATTPAAAAPAPSGAATTGE